ncbi:MAG: hypothetical protein D6735_12280, partial [Acidobacteria bacterium]
MNVLKNNPYRILGLPANSSEKELQRQIATIRRFAEIGRVKSFDYDFPFFGDLVRNPEKVQEAASKIEQAKNRIHYALFWFINNGYTDQIALHYLKEGRVDEAIKTWQENLKSTVVTSENFSVINNLSTLQLGIATCNNSFDLNNFTHSINLKGRLILSETFDNFAATVVGESINIEKELILKGFVDEILALSSSYLDKPNGLDVTHLIRAFRSFPDETRKYVSGKFTDGPLTKIENQIEKTKQKRSDDPKNSAEHARALYKNVKEDLIFLKKIWGDTDIRYQMIANKLAEEILQCAIDFFAEYRDSDEYDPGEDSLEITRIAAAIGPTGKTKSRLDENIQRLQEWINERAERERLKGIKRDIEFVARKLSELEELPETISNVTSFVIACKPKLDNIKAKLGPKDELYLKISSAVVNSALNVLVSIVNKKQESVLESSKLSTWNSSTFNIARPEEETLASLSATVAAAAKIMNFMATMDMTRDIRKRFKQNQSILSSLQSALSRNREGKRGSSTIRYIFAVLTMCVLVYVSYPYLIELIPSSVLDYTTNCCMLVGVILILYVIRIAFYAYKYRGI